MENFLQQGVNAAKAGDKARAFQLLTRATQDSTTAEQAWLWLAGVVTNDAERLFCLDNALRINPSNEPAKSKAGELRQRGIFPATPTPLQAPPPMANPPAQTVASQPATPSLAVQPNSGLVQTIVPEPPRASAVSQQNLSGPYRFAAQEFARKQSSKAITKKLIDQGLTPDTANQVVTETEKLWRKALVDKNKKRMTRGLIWAVIGIVLTCGTMALASSQGGGRYVLFYGAIIFGVIDFFAGLIGWLWNT